MVFKSCDVSVAVNAVRIGRVTDVVTRLTVICLLSDIILKVRKIFY